MGKKQSKSQDKPKDLGVAEKLDIELKNLEANKKKFKKPDPVLAQSFLAVSNLYNQLGDHQNAYKHGKEALDIYEKINKGKNQLLYAKALEYVSILQTELGDHENSLKTSITSLDLYKKINKKNNADTARQLENVAICYKNLQDPENSLKHAIESLKLRQEMNKKDNIDTARSLSDVGRFYCSFGNIKDGLKFLLKSLEMYDNIPNEAHQAEIARLLACIAIGYRDYGNNQKALYYALESMKITLNLHEGNHVEIANSLSMVGLAHKNVKDCLNTLKYCLISVKMYEALESNDYDEEIAELYSIIANCYLKRGDRDQSLRNSLRSLKIYEKLNQKSEKPHAKMANLSNNISRLYGTLGDPDCALKYSINALEMNQELYKRNHLEIARSLANVGGAYGNLEMPDKSLRFNLKGLEMFDNLSEGRNDAEVANALYNVACSYGDLDDWHCFLKYTIESLDKKQKLFDKDHYGILVLLSNAALGHYKIGDPSKAVKYAQNALDIVPSVFNSPHPFISNTLFLIAKSYQRLGDESSMIENKLKAFQMRYLLKMLFNYNLSFDAEPEKFKHEFANFRYRLQRPLESKKHLMISFAGDYKNRSECLDIKEALEMRKFRVYVDLNNLHEKSVDAMLNAVDDSLIVVVCLNRNYLNSDLRMLESRYAVAQNKLIIPVLLEKEVLDKDLSLFKANKESLIKYYDYEDSEDFAVRLVEKINISSDPLAKLGYEEWFRENGINLNLFNRLKPCDKELLKNLNSLSERSLHTVLDQSKVNADEYNGDDVDKFKRHISTL